MHDDFLDPYCLPNGCLRNKLGITDADALAQIEARIVSARDVELATQSLPGEYNLEHYLRFHGSLFGDVYDWAGKTRTVNISKGPEVLFAQWQFVADQVSAVLSELENDRWLIGRSQEAFLPRLAYFYGELNARHPFREGNGRTLRAFLRQLSAAAGWRLDWSALRREANINASRHNLITASVDQLVDVLRPVVHMM
jgi:cell filamentation protein